MPNLLRSILLMVFCFLLFANLSAQPVWVEGRVISAEDGKPLVGVSILLLDFRPVTGTTTDTDGTFRILAPADGDLQFSYVAKKLREVSVAEIIESPEVELENEFMSGLSVTVTAKLNYDELYTPTVQRLDQSALWVNDAMNISQAFDGLPGIQVQQGALNTQRLSMRGIGARTPFATNQVRLYWNDFPLTNGAGESVLEDIESGFLRMAYAQTGPAPAALGANLGGSIQLVSKEWDAPNWGTSAGLSVGDFGRNREWVNLHNTAGSWQQDLSIVRSASDGYRDNNDYARVSGTALGRILHDQGETIYLLHLRQMEAEIPSSLNAVDFIEKPTAAAFNWAAVNGREDQLTYLLGLQHRQKVADLGNRWGSLVNRSSVFGGRRTNDEVRPFDIINENSYQYGLRTNFQLRNARAVGGSLQLGGELFLENYDQTTFEVLDGGAQGTELGEQSETRVYYFLFGQWTARWGNSWRTLIAANLRQTQYNWQAVNLDQDYYFDPVLLPGVTVFYEPENQKLRLHARYNRGISQPDPSTSISNSIVDAQPLRAASGWNREVGVAWGGPAFQLQLTAFRMDVEDALVQRQDAVERTFFFNGGSTRHQGVELSLDKTWSLTNGKVVINSSYTLADYRFLDFKEVTDDFSGNDLPGVHPHRWRSNLSWRADRFNASLSLDIAAAQWVDDANTTQADGYSVLHTRIGYGFPSLGRGLRLYAGCNNLLNEAYASMVQVNAGGFGGNLPRYFYPGLPRYFYFGMDYGL